MIVNIKNAKFLNLNRRQNIAYGIQKWLLERTKLCGKGDQVNSKEYEKLLTEFCSQQKDFDASKVKNFESIESYVNERFLLFKDYCKQLKQKQNESTANNEAC